MTTTLGICAQEISSVLCDALAAAAPSTVGTPKREIIARKAVDDVQAIASCWLNWYEAAEPRKLLPPAVCLPQDLTLACMQHADVREYVNLLRRVMHLRRQQARLIAVMNRLAAASKVCDMCAMLRSKIMFLPTNASISNN